MASPLVQQAAADMCAQLDSSAAAIRGNVCTMLAKQCQTKLEACKGIPRQYRHTGRKAPTTHSEYITSVFAPLEEFTKSCLSDAALLTMESRLSDGQDSWVLPVVVRSVTFAIM